MAPQQVEKLIEKFYAGEISEEEQETLREKLNSPDCPEGYEMERMMLGAFEEIKAENDAQIPEFEHPAEIRESHQNSGSKSQNPFSVFHAAASVAILIAFFSGFWLIQNPMDENDVGAFRNDKPISADEAKAETVKAFEKISSAMESGEEELQNVSEISIPEVETKND